MSSAGPAQPVFLFGAAEAPPADFSGAALNAQWLAEEAPLVRALAAEAALAADGAAQVAERARALVQAVRTEAGRRSGLGGALDDFLRQYSLDSQEGVLLLCLAEALLRIPDAATADALISDKLGAGDWQRHLGEADSLLVNASTWGLLLTGRLVAPDTGLLTRLLGRVGEPAIRAAVRQAMRILGFQFVMGRTIEEALARAAAEEGAYRHSFDMLGESALGQADAERYLASYHAAIACIGQAVAGQATRLLHRPGLSVKLSALHPRFEPAQHRQVMTQLLPRLKGLVAAARAAGIPITVDAEEADRLELTLRLVEAVLASSVCDGYEGLGLAVQAYQKRAPATLDWLEARARWLRRRLCVRLVKGAYWDSEIKRAQERGLAGFPVYTRKASTDVAYLACARRLAAATDVIYPQFATHNAHSVAYVLELMAGREGDFEFQRLHGMGTALYAQLIGRHACRVYAPVGAHRDLLPYLVRRLLENGANTSFVNRLADAQVPLEEVVRDPLATTAATPELADPRIRLPVAISAPVRANARGLNLADPRVLESLARELAEACATPWRAAPLLAQGLESGALAPQRVSNPARRGEVVGEVCALDPALLPQAVARAQRAQPAWDALGGEDRARLLEQAAVLVEREAAGLAARCVREAGRTVADSLGEVREAVDLLRYYAAQARRDFGEGEALTAVAGESNQLRLRGRGVFACVSPWNFPVAIFTGQLAAALAAGNTVLAKPAAQSPLAAAAVTALLHEAGIPRDVLQLLPGGAELGAALVREPGIAGVAFTGSTRSARRIAASLAGREGALATLIAETGGLNALIADSSALPDQLVPDVLASAFNSAGQRCSALRLLFVQEEIAPRVQELLAEALAELQVGDPSRLETDIGPVIDEEARQRLQDYAAQLKSRAGGRWQCQARLAADLDGHFVAPLAIEVAAAELPTEEVFGPILHVVRFRAEELDAVVARINGLGYGLTLGIHTRIASRARRIAAAARVGNVYVNRNLIGAVVGMQPFGGVGLSGTGPKAGGPGYLPRFAWEQTVTTNTAAIGGNASLLTLG